MKKQHLLSIILILFVNLLSAQETRPKKNYTAQVDFTNAPEHISDVLPLSDQANEGKWTMISTLSDEFDASSLDTEKWYECNPKWKGRPPTLFHKDNQSLRDGFLVMKINKHPEGEVLPKDFTHTSAFVKSKKKVLYGYLEARMKLMDAPWVSGFWVTNVGKDWWTEIDICENCPGNPINRYDLNSNVHVFRAPKDKGDVDEHFNINAKYQLPFQLQDDFHVWGLEWTEDYIRFYIDGVLFREQENTHWHQPLEVNINNESNKWFGALPNENIDEEFLIDYFRYFKSKD